MAELSKGHVFVPGEVVDPDDLNDLVDAATAVKGIVMDQPSTVPVPADDSVVFYDLTTDNLARCKISALPSGVTSVAFTATPGTVFNDAVGDPTGAAAISLGLATQGANKVLIGPVSGLAVTPAFRVLSPADIPIATVTIGALTLDWSLGNMFNKGLTANSTFIFTNPTEGQTIRFRVVQDAAHTVAWTSPIRWPGGTPPVMTPLAGRADIFTFSYIGGFYYGTFDQNFSL